MKFKFESITKENKSDGKKKVRNNFIICESKKVILRSK